jgi:phytoene/squalene synthetase
MARGTGIVTQVSDETDPRLRYERAAYRAAHDVLAAYSTSFGLGTRLLGRHARRHIEAVYALVRIADEIVDTHRGTDAGRLLTELREQTESAMREGWSTNPVVHAFARTAARVGIGDAEIGPFFDSMAMDLTVTTHDRASYERYVYGSAEVVGVMCARVFLNADRPPGDPVVEPDAETLAGARALGAGFQKVNFLRDLAADHRELGRSYFPGLTPEAMDADSLDAVVTEIGADLAAARAALPRLPGRARSAVAATLAIYERLLAVLADTPPQEIIERRVRISDPEKVLIALQGVLLELPGRGERRGDGARPGSATATPAASSPGGGSGADEEGS